MLIDGKGAVHPLTTMEDKKRTIRKTCENANLFNMGPSTDH
jgi:hypothetical protein